MTISANDQNQMTDLWEYVRQRIGICPSVFKSADGPPEVSKHLFGMVEGFYLDSSVPPLLKEKLNVYLSRFCLNRYCILRHSAFLLGYGHISGRADIEPVSMEEVLDIISEPVPGREELDRLLYELKETSKMGEDWPAFSSREGYLLRVAVASVFIEPENALPWAETLREYTGNKKYEILMGLVACARFMQFWVTIHPNLEYEEDLHTFLQDHPQFLEVINNQKMAKERVMLDSALHAELVDLRHMAKLSDALIISEDRFRAAVQAVNGILWTNTPSGQMEGEQPGWQSLTHQSYEAYQGYGWAEAVHPDDAQPTIEAWNEAVRESKAFIFQHRVRRYDGEWRRFSVRAIPVKDENGAILEWVGVHTDITEQYEQADRLRKAKAEAEEANQAKTDFLANMTHEIRTPMNAIIGLTELLNRGQDLPEKYRKIVKTLKLSADSLMELINDLLDMSRLESNHMEFEELAFAPAAVIRDVIDILQVNARTKKLNIRTNIDDYLQNSYIGDPQRFKQIIANLLSNAIKFTDQGEINVQMEVRPLTENELIPAAKDNKFTEDNTSLVCITVKDTGIGIAPEKQEAIFQKFTQADSSITRRYGGSGLGLTISRNLAEGMSGKLTVESRPEQGSEFTLTLPLLYGNNSSGMKGEDTPNGIDRSSAAGSKPLVLLVEDYEPNVMVARHILEMIGYVCDVATNGYEALELAKQKHGTYMAVLMDVQMPGMDGMETTRQIRKYEKECSLSHMPIVAVTAHSGKEDIRNAMNAGMDHYISKPYTFQDITDLLDSLKDKKRDAGGRNNLPA
ncbi:MAG: ATP-binding protein [Cyclobacteriaceae bacterium]